MVIYKTKKCNSYITCVSCDTNDNIIICNKWRIRLNVIFAVENRGLLK